MQGVMTKYQSSGLTFVAAMLASAVIRAAEGPVPGKLVFVAASNAEAYSQSLDGFRSLFPNVTAIVLDSKDPLHTPTLPIALAGPVSLIVAAGSDAVNAVVANKPEAPVIATMVLNADSGT